MGWSHYVLGVTLLAVTALPASAAEISLRVISGEPARVGVPIVIVFGLTSPAKLDAPSKIKAGALTFELRRPRTGEGIEYVAVPKEPGTFILPVRDWKAPGQRLKSPGRIFEVQSASSATPTPARADPQPPSKPRIFDPQRHLSARAAAFATPPPARGAPVLPDPPGPGALAPDLESFAGFPQVASTNVFLGEAVPITLKFFLRADRAFEDLLRPSYAGDGFYSGPVDELPPATVRTNGGLFHQITLQTTIEPLLTGPLEVGGLVLHGRETMERPDPRRPSPRWTNFSLPSASLRFEVAPLPAERPDDFTGGVGQFKVIAPQIKPKPPKAGEPFTLRLGVQGLGNFRAMQRPVLDPSTTNGWRVYDAGETVERTAADGSGTKYFEFQLVAVQDRKQTPRAALSYFDPQQKKFVRLQFSPEPINAAADPAAVAATPSPVPENPSMLPPATPDAARSFDPIVASSWFRALQILIAVLFLGWIFWFLARRRAGRGPAARRARLREEYREARENFRDAPPDRRSFYDAAAQVVVARLGVLDGKPVSREEAGRTLERLVPNLAQREELVGILDRSDELNYAAVETGPLDDTERAGVVRVLEMFDERVS